MSKYGCLRPAGMSDDDDDDDDDYFFEKEDIKERNYSSREDSWKTESDLDDVRVNEECVHEDYAMKACIKGDLEAIQNHFQNVAYDINKFLYTGWTLLLYAASSVQPEIIRYLLTLDADPNKSKEGFTPLMALCSSTKGTPERFLECLVLLIQAKADVNLTSKRRETALMYACMSQNVEFVTELIKHINDINVCDSDGKAALSYAATANKPDIVKILLEHNADTSLLDKNYLTAKDIADKKGFTEISALLAQDEEEKPIVCEVFDRKTWKDLFSDLYPRGQEVLDDYVSSMLSGMNLGNYKILFRGMNLKTFLQLTEDDIYHLGIDITVHREQFLEDLEKFHLKRWNLRSLGSTNNLNPCSIYDNIILLANAKEKIAVIGASFQYIKNNLIKAASENIYLSPLEVLKYEEELKETQKNLKNLKNEIICFKKLAQKIDKEDDIGVPAIYISSKKNKSKIIWNNNWIISLSITLIGLYLCKTTHVKRLWNIYNIKM
ncbi:ankyrin repeat, SAM and basic leucine zipper domain-containing protein 1-like [Camponotus floridanus]|uniref:ankyrin repeat, SAM and basic leucine zipper domain-containing protein 1-like n=1 Tax=Camponotus floridanus TaxID=104421 RepID=UPI00059DF9CA|nr:ankyrin repeat, SAM and basic leucine zipper domain-containing protein 1-like [Camponotus floridanus]